LERIGELLRGGHFWVTLGSFFGFGILLSFTPCVLPLVPILSGIVVGQGHALNRRRAAGLSLAYVLGMAVAYALAGVAAGLSGTLVSNALQNPWVIASFGALLGLLALSMFGLYELQLPARLRDSVLGAGNAVKGGNLIGASGLGAVSALIVSPCVAAPLAGALLYIGQTGNVTLGGAALFAMALGMGVPLLLVGVSAGHLLPRAGAWMETVKKFFGFVLLGLALWVISPLLSAAAAMLLGAALLIVAPVYLGALDRLTPASSGYQRFWKALGILVLAGGIALFAGTVARPGGAPLAALWNDGGSASALKFQPVRSVAELDSRIRESTGKYVLVDFYADWCVACKEMERFTFTDPRVQALLRDTVLLRVDVTANSNEDQALLRRFELFGPPGTIFFDRNGKEIKAQRVVGYQPAEEFLTSLQATTCC
jgi:thiol:disulfide interchange protein DsbD